jgi:hypothetical protein
MACYLLLLTFYLLRARAWARRWKKLSKLLDKGILYYNMIWYIVAEKAILHALL